jgi:hypothetical protein
MGVLHKPLAKISGPVWTIKWPVSESGVVAVLRALRELIDGGPDTCWVNMSQSINLSITIKG